MQNNPLFLYAMLPVIEAHPFFFKKALSLTNQPVLTSYCAQLHMTGFHGNLIMSMTFATFLFCLKITLFFASAMKISGIKTLVYLAYYLTSLFQCFKLYQFKL